MGILTFLGIRNKKLRNLIKDSLKFRELEDIEQKNFLERISRLSEEDQEELCTFFVIENRKDEKIMEEANEKLKNMVSSFITELKDLGKKYYVKGIHHREEISQKEEKNAQEALLKDIGDL